MMNQENAHSGANPETREPPSVETHVEAQAGAPDESDAFEQSDHETGEDSISSAAPEPEAPPVTSTPLPLPPPIPSGTLPLLDAQLGEALNIVQDLAAYIRHPSTPIHDSVSAADSVSRLVLASATLGKVAMRLQSGEPESRHRVIVEYAEAQGERVCKSRKRINRDD
jgi:hypothetical protein